MTLKTRVRYHIVTEPHHDALRRKYDLTGDDPYRFVIYERDFPLSSALADALVHHEGEDKLGCRAG
jgi:hypothetical protein